MGDIWISELEEVYCGCYPFDPIHELFEPQLNFMEMLLTRKHRRTLLSLNLQMSPFAFHGEKKSGLAK